MGLPKIWIATSERTMGAKEPYLAQEVSATQEDGSLPTIRTVGSAPGESGVIVWNARFVGAMHFRATPRWHHICFQISTQSRFDCRIADRKLLHRPQAGSLAICPAGIDCAADVDGGVEALLVAVDPGRFALGAAEEAALEAQLIERLSGYDRTLLDLARGLAAESAAGYPNGSLFWDEIASAFIDGLVARHTSAPKSRARGMLSKDVLDRLTDYVVAHLDQPIEVAALAKIAGRSPFHFTRVFARSVGMTPHRYIVHLRLRRAIELVREGRCSLAEIAARTGFADQSHLSRWVRRVRGASLTQLAA
jgi:AraC family transcriptional regulator